MPQQSLFADDAPDDLTNKASVLLRLVKEYPDQTTNQLVAHLWEKDKSKIEHMGLELGKLLKSGLVQQSDPPEPCPVSGFMAVRWSLTNEGRKRL